MGSVQPLRQSPPPRGEASLRVAHPRSVDAAVVRRLDAATCALCGVKLASGVLRCQVVPPRSCDAPITVCYLCRRAALGEGYRPA